MDPQPLPQQKKKGHKMKLLLVILAIVLVLGGVAYFFLVTPQASPQQTVATEIIPSIDFSIFDSESFERFKVWGVIPVTVGETGKENPFSE